MTHANAGTRIREARDGRGWTQQDLAHKADLTTKTVSTAENYPSAVSRSTLRRIAKTLGLDPDELVAAAVEVAS